MATGFPGNHVFWADQQHLFSAVDSQNYTVPADTAIIVDGQSIALRAGDNAHTIMAKINSAPVAVKASLDPVTNGLVLETTQPHQLFVQDQGGTVLRDLGVVSARPGVQPPHNLSQDARVFGGSMFDAVIHLRDNLLAGNKDYMGGQGLASVQASMANLQTTISELGSRDSRLEFVSQRLEQEQPKVVEKLANEIDLDLTEGITRLKMLDTTHQAALRTAAKILPTTLMDYLR
jgi:flagellar hook-associated protein 3 FlgL